MSIYCIATLTRTLAFNRHLIMLLSYCHMVSMIDRSGEDAMKVLVFAATKGGTGKSTLAYNVGMFAAGTHKVLFADLDPQGSLTELWERRGRPNNPSIVRNVHGVAAGAARLRAAGYAHDYLIVDTPGAHIPIIREAIASADVVVLPVQPSALDIMGQEAAFDLIARAGLQSRTLIVLNRVDGRSKAFADKIEARLKSQTNRPVLRVAQRSAYAKAGAEVKTGIETDKDAFAEIAGVWAAIQGVTNHDGR